jgi:hypothetical protein
MFLHIGVHIKRPRFRVIEKEFRNLLRRLRGSMATSFIKKYVIMEADWSRVYELKLSIPPRYFPRLPPYMKALMRTLILIEKLHVTEKTCLDSLNSIREVGSPI